MAVAVAGTLSVTLAAVDRITAPIGRITATVTRLQTTLGAATTKLRAMSQLDRVAGAARGVVRSLTQIIPPLSAITGAASIAGVIGLASRWAGFASVMGQTAYRVMTTASGLGALQNAGRLAGVGAEAVTQGLQGLGDALSDAIGGRDSTALQYFSLLGIRMRDAAGQARTASEVLPEVADGIARIADPRLQARVMGALRLPESMLPFLKQGSAGLRRWEEDARRFGVVTEEGAAIGAKFAETQERLKMAAEGLVNSIAQRLAPVIGPMLERLSAWIGANRELIAQRVEEVVTRLAAAAERFVAEGGLQDIAGHIGSIVSGITKVVEWMGGWEKAAIGLGAVLTANLVLPLAAIATSLVAIGAFRAPAWILRMMGGAGAAATAGVAGAAGWELGNLRTRLRDDALRRLQEAQERDRAENGGNGWLDSDNSLASWGRALVERLRRNLTPGTPSAPAATSRAPAPGRAASDPRGLRNNNPLNLTHVRGQQGLDPAAPSDGRFGRYTTMEAGVAQAVRQMQIHAGRGFDTIGKLIQKWAPETENDTGGYVRRVEQETGLSRDTRIDFNDEAMLLRLVRAMARHENGRTPDEVAMQRGIGMATGRLAVPPPPAPAAPAPARAALPGPSATPTPAPATSGGPATMPAPAPSRVAPPGPLGTLIPAPAPAAPAAPAASAGPAVMPAPAPAASAAGPGNSGNTSPAPAAQRIDLRISGLPAGVTATTTTRDPGGGVRVERAMMGNGP